MFIRCYIGVEWKNWLVKEWKWGVVRNIRGKDGKGWRIVNGKGCFGEEFEVLWDGIVRE